MKPPKLGSLNFPKWRLIANTFETTQTRFYDLKKNSRLERKLLAKSWNKSQHENLQAQTVSQLVISHEPHEPKSIMPPPWKWFLKGFGQRNNAVCSIQGNQTTFAIKFKQLLHSWSSKTITWNLTSSAEPKVIPKPPWKIQTPKSRNPKNSLAVLDI